jgi:hypothetical protein
VNIRSLTRITFGQREAQHISKVLFYTENLIPELELLLEAICGGLLEAGDDFEVETEVTLPLDVLQALTRVFAKRTRQKDRSLGLDPSLGYNIAESLVLAFAKARRYDTEPAVEEVDATAALFGEIV